MGKLSLVLDYAGGMMTDWGVHLLDIVQWAMEVDYPESVSAHGGKFILNDNRETPDVIAATYQYPDFVCTYENRETNRLPIDGKEYGISFHGTYGTLIVDRGGFEIIPEPGSDLEPETHERVNPEVNHLADFFNSMRSREKPICDIEIGHRSSTTAILGNIAYRSGRTIKWNGETETVLDDMAAHNMTRARYRRPWSI